MDIGVATAFVGAVQVVAVTALTIIGKIHASAVRLQASAVKELAGAINHQTVVQNDMRDRLTVQQERFDAAHREVIHNLANIRTALQGICPYDHTKADTIHDAAQATLMRRKGSIP